MGTTTFLSDGVTGPVSFYAGLHDRISFRGTDCTDDRADAPFLVRVRMGDASATALEGTELTDGIVVAFVEASHFGAIEVSCDGFGDDCSVSGGFGISGFLTGASTVPEPAVAGGLVVLLALLGQRRSVRGA